MKKNFLKKSRFLTLKWPILPTKWAQTGPIWGHGGLSLGFSGSQTLRGPSGSDWEQKKFSENFAFFLPQNGGFWGQKGPFYTQNGLKWAHFGPVER